MNYLFRAWTAGQRDYEIEQWCDTREQAYRKAKAYSGQGYIWSIDWLDDNGQLIRQANS